MRRKRILVATTYEPNDTTAFLRSWGPFTLMKDEVEVVRKPYTDRTDWFRDWHYWYDIDVCFVHRACSSSFTHLIHYAKLHGVPVWVDHDDDLLAITNDNPVFFSYNQQDNRDAIENSYREADILTCSGEAMYDDFIQKYNRNPSDTFLITTGLDDRLLRFRKPFNKNNRVGWRGSKSHLTDLLLYQRDITYLMQEFKDRAWYFWGINPYFLNWDGQTDLKWTDQLNLYPFLAAMTHQNCSLHMVPLVDHKFNRVKSNLSWLDASLAGSATVAPDFEHFNKPGILQYSSKDQTFFQTMQAALKGEYDLEEMHKQSWEYISDCLMQSKLNEKRREILKNL